MSEEAFGEERLLGNSVRVYIDSGNRLGPRPTGITFLLTAANIPLDKYITMRDALRSTNQVVVGYMINTLNPPLRNHRSKAQNVRDVFDELQTEFRGIDRFDIVGHSVGGKVALLVAALHNDDGAVRNVIALDPVDQSPVEFTNKNTDKNLKLPAPESSSSSIIPTSSSSSKSSKSKSSKGFSLGKKKLPDLPDLPNPLSTSRTTSITMTHTDTGFFVKNEHNARSIHKFNPHTKLINHRNAGHMCYCDAEGGKVSWNAVMKVANPGNPDRNRICKEEAIRLIKDKSTSSMKKGIKNAKKDVVSSFQDLKKDAEGLAQGGLASMVGKSLMPKF